MEQPQQQAICISTLQHQQQHFAFLRSDAGQLQHKVVQEVAKFEEHTLLLKDFLFKFVDEFADAQQLPHGEYKYRNLLVRRSDSLNILSITESIFLNITARYCYYPALIMTCESFHSLSTCFVHLFHLAGFICLLSPLYADPFDLPA